jgi:hypothetical protein
MLVAQATLELFARLADSESDHASDACGRIAMIDVSVPGPGFARTLE